MRENDGLICAYKLEPDDQGRELNWANLDSWKQEDGIVWIHLDRGSESTQQWIREKSGLEPIVGEALLEEETRPRGFVYQQGFLIILRGVNLNPGADPEDMISIRVWIEPHRIISLCRRPVMAIQDLREQFAARSGPGDAGEFLVRLIDRLTDRMEPIVSSLLDEVDEMEDQIGEQAHIKYRSRLGNLRRETIGLRRYLAPQRDVLSRLQVEQTSWLTSTHRLHLREIGDHLIRYVEDLDASRERIAVMREEVTARLAEQMTQNMYLLTILAGIFLPLSFFTGLLGINVGGIPGAQNSLAFWIVCGVLGGLVVLQVWLYRRLKLL